MRLKLQQGYLGVIHILLHLLTVQVKQKFSVLVHQKAFKDHLEYFYSEMKQKLS